MAAPIAFIALGSNLGDPSGNIREAMRKLESLSDEPIVRSSLWRSTPVDCPPGSPPFLNAAVSLVPRADATPESLLKALQTIEQEFGRQPKKVLNEPRPLDLDLIAFGSAQRNSPRLILPHPRAHLRQFVLEPLAEIAPALVLPGQPKTVLQLLKEATKDPALARVASCEP